MSDHGQGRIPESYRRRIGVAYLRQSSLAQLRDHTGSTALQRDLAEVLKDLGFQQIEVVDGDLGVSGAVPGARSGFNSLVDHMKTGNVGLVAVTDISRLARNYQDLATFATAAQKYDVLFWHSGQIVIFRDPTNELLSLIMGLFGVQQNKSRVHMSCAARRKKAEDGRAVSQPPSGYVAAPGGAWLMDDEPRARDALRLVFDKIWELRSGLQVAGWLLAHGIKLPGGPSRARRRWIDATPSGVVRILRNPTYAGTYVYGKTTTLDVYGDGGKQRPQRTRRSDSV